MISRHSLLRRGSGLIEHDGGHLAFTPIHITHTDNFINTSYTIDRVYKMYLAFVVFVVQRDREVFLI